MSMKPIRVAETLDGAYLAPDGNQL